MKFSCNGGGVHFFNHKNNVDYRNARVVCFNLKKLGAGLRTIAMHIINDLMNSRVSHNFSRGIATWCCYDKFHVLLQDELTSSCYVTIWKMLRKKGCVPSALTQNVKDLLASWQTENITMEGRKDIPGVWIVEHESSKLWLNVLNDLKNRGVLDVFLFCTDGLCGMPQAIEAVCPKSRLQRCIVHQIRSSTRYVSYKDMKQVDAETKKIYTAVTE